MFRLILVPFLAFALAVCVHVDALTSFSQALDREVLSDHVLVEPPAVELPLFAPPVSMVASVDACDVGDVEAQHEVEAATAVRLGSQVPARRWFHHERGCVAF